MGSGIMQYWVNGKICVDDKIKNGEYPFKNQSSSIPYLRQAFKPQKISYIFIKLQKFRDVN